MTGIGRVGNPNGQALPAVPERASQGIGSPGSTASPQFAPIAGRAPQASSAAGGPPRLSLSSAQSKLSKLFTSPASPSSGSPPGQSRGPVPGSPSGPAPLHGLQITGNQTSSRGVNKPDSVVPPELLGGTIPPEVFRGDTRPPEVIFNQGFQPFNNGPITLNSMKDHVIYNEPGPFVSTSSSHDVALHYAKQGGGDSHVYGITPHKTHSIDVNHILGAETPLIWEHEVLLAGGVSGSQVGWGEHAATGARVNNPRYGNPDAQKYPAGSAAQPAASTSAQPPPPFVGNPFAASPPLSPKHDPSSPSSSRPDSPPPRYDSSGSSSPTPKYDSSPPHSPEPMIPFDWFKGTSS